MLARIERRAPISEIELGLERVRRVLDRLEPDLSATRVISVGGTNGKGSTVAFIEAIARRADRRVLALTSPHVVHFGERFRLNGESLSDRELRDALARVEDARGDDSLTWFEHVTLAGFELAGRLRPDWLVAEVGMGGRLDAVNVLDADVAVITSIGLDHQRWLGSTRSAIAREKCGIARAARPVVVGEKRRPKGMRHRLAEIEAEALLAGRDFNWRWRGERVTLDLPDERLGPVTPGLAGRHQGGNAACAALAVRRLEPDLPARWLVDGIARASLIGRFQRLLRAPDVVVDVAHNPAAARKLGEQLRRLPGRNMAVFGVLGDKDVAGIVRALAPVFDRWFLVSVDGPRGLDARSIRRRAPAVADRCAPEALESMTEALAAARSACRPDDRVVVFGSFLTVSAAFDALGIRPGNAID